MSEYRYSIDSDGVIGRGKIERNPEDYGGDQWRHYWDGDGLLAFVDNYRDGMHLLTDEASDMSDIGKRVMTAFKRSGRSTDLLNRIARLLNEQPDSTFIRVGLDRGSDLYALSWDGDPTNVWRDEIEAVHYGDVYRIVADKQIGTVNGYDPLWLEDESDCTEYYGEDNALDELARQFPLDEYPAEQMVSSDG